MEIKTLLEQRGLLIFDGAMGTQLQAKGLKTGETPELLNLTAKDLLKEIHRSYIDAGADIISASKGVKSPHIQPIMPPIVATIAPENTT